ncbi:MAG: type II toxin-antitoxin system RelE/ParE family toxin [Nitrococcus mobilis]|nr:type II toxin-antitoxin system RelE/ParE family toxin [Nitrococcus mobilis]
MAEVVWSEPALADLDAIADYIALENPTAAKRLVRNIFDHIDQLEAYPDSGSFPQELKDRRYRQIVEPPFRVIYRHDKKQRFVFILHVMRSEQKLRRSKLHRGQKSRS